MHGKEYMHYAAKEMGLAARAPHAYLPMLLCDRIPNERALALQFGLRLLEEAISFWCAGTESVWECRGRFYMPFHLNYQS